MLNIIKNKLCSLLFVHFVQSILNSLTDKIQTSKIIIIIM